MIFTKLLPAFLMLQESAPADDSAVRTVQIVSGLLAVVCVIAIIMRRKSKKKKSAAEDDF